MCLATASRTRAQPAVPGSFTSLGRRIHVINDTNDRGVHRRRLPAQRGARGLALDHDEHALADTGADRVDGQHGHAARLAVERQRLHEQQLGAVELVVLLRGDDRADRRDRSALRPRSFARDSESQ